MLVKVESVMPTLNYDRANPVGCLSGTQINADQTKSIFLRSYLFFVLCEQITKYAKQKQKNKHIQGLLMELILIPSQKKNNCCFS